MEIKKKGSQRPTKGPTEYFTGNVRIDPLFQAPHPARAVGASVTFAHLARSKVPEFTLPHAVTLGFVLAVTAVIGDLIESLFKREAGVKDSGGFFPGIGGILDLLDSLLFNAPLMYLYLRHVITNPALHA